MIITIKYIARGNYYPVQFKVDKSFNVQNQDYQKKFTSIVIFFLQYGMIYYQNVYLFCECVYFRNIWGFTSRE